MGQIVDQLDSGQHVPASVRCPICGAGNRIGERCRHVRWTFDQGTPVDLARAAVEISPYTRNRGFRLSDIPNAWWQTNGEWVVEQVLTRFAAIDGYVFGEVGDLDNLARDVWHKVRPEAARAQIVRQMP